MTGSTVLLSMLGLWAGVLADPETIRAAHLTSFRTISDKPVHVI